MSSRVLWLNRGGEAEVILKVASILWVTLDNYIKDR